MISFGKFPARNLRKDYVILVILFINKSNAINANGETAFCCDRSQ